MLRICWLFFVCCSVCVVRVLVVGCFVDRCLLCDVCCCLVLVARCRLVVVRCSLCVVVWCLLVVIRCLLLVVCCALRVFCSLLVFDVLLFVARWVLLAVY